MRFPVGHFCYSQPRPAYRIRLAVAIVLRRVPPAPRWPAVPLLQRPGRDRSACRLSVLRHIGPFLTHDTQRREGTADCAGARKRMLAVVRRNAAAARMTDDPCLTNALRRSSVHGWFFGRMIILGGSNRQQAER
jgi:hypothetical protein